MWNPTTQKIQVKQIYPTLIQGNGIMTDLASFDVPWSQADYIASLDIGYYWHSAQKLISPMVFDLSENISNINSNTDLSSLTSEQRATIAGVLFQMFGRKWTKLYNIYSVTYNPIHNYVMNETESTERDVTRSGSDTGTVTTLDTGTVTDSGTEGGTLTTVTDKDTSDTGTQTNAGTNSSEDGVFGFNSSTAVGSDTSAGSNSNTRTDNLASTEDTTVTETRNLTEGNTRTLNTSDQETRNLAHSDTESDDVARELTRQGTTGIYTPQQLLNDEIELWQWNFYKQVFEDIDSILCLEIY